VIDLLKTLSTALDDEANNIVKHISDGLDYKSDFFDPNCKGTQKMK
jgi:hypothetical protein